MAKYYPVIPNQSCIVGRIHQIVVMFTMPKFPLYLLIIALFSLTSQLAVAANNKLQLSEKEQAWLAAHPTVTFTGDPNWLPYEAFDSHGNYIGIVAEHLRLISKSTGLKFKMSPSKTWTESTEKAKQGLVDILSETDDSDLKSHLNFTTPYVSNPIVIAMHSSENYVEDINSIHKSKIALIKDYGYASKIRRKYTQIEFVTVDDIQDDLLAVSTGKVDALLCTLALCSYTIAELGLNNVKITGKTEFDTKLALGVQKNLPELLSILNKAIKHISREQQQAILDSWIKDKFVRQTDHTLVIQLAALFLLLLTIFWFWNRSLQRQIRMRMATESTLIKAEEVLRISHQRLLSHREHTPLGVIEWNTHFEVIDWNHAAENIFGYTKEEAEGRHAAEIIIPENAREDVNEVWLKLLAMKGGSRSTNENITKDGRTILCEWYNTPLIDQDGHVIGVASLIDDVTERKRSEEMIWKQANFDMLTGLNNRNMFNERLTQEMSRSDREQFPLALLLIDLDQFKEVNDTLGHDIGDTLLQEAGQRISNCVRNSDTVARLGGDEFTVILPDLNDNDHVEDIAEKIIHELEQEYHIGNETIHISASIGITLYPDDASSKDTLVKNADQAMYAAKRKGRHCFSYFTQSLQDAAQNRLRLSNDLRKALGNDEFEVYYQPIVDLKTQHLVKAEALVRWHHPTRGMVDPFDFIHLAEETGLINNIGLWVLEQSVIKTNVWRNKLNNNFQISVNISPIQFKLETRNFIKQWQDFLQAHNIPGESIVVEITEGLLLDAEPEVIDKLLWLRDAGIQVAIDDFGTGYSSLSYLNKFDIDYLKIDKSFVNNLENKSNDITLCEAIIGMAHTLGLQVIAEGIETPGQQRILTEAGCDYGQGYLFSRPVPADDFENLIHDEISFKR